MNSEVNPVRQLRELLRVTRCKTTTWHWVCCVEQKWASMDREFVRLITRVKSIRERLRQLQEVAEACASCGAVACCDCTGTRDRKGKPK